MLIRNQNKWAMIVLAFIASSNAHASDAREAITVQDYFSSSFQRLKIKQCNSSEADNGPWPLKRVFIKVKPQIGIGINQVLSLTAIPEIGLSFERVNGERLRAR